MTALLQEIKIPSFILKMVFRKSGELIFYYEIRAIEQTMESYFNA